MVVESLFEAAAFGVALAVGQLGAVVALDWRTGAFGIVTQPSTSSSSGSIRPTSAPGGLHKRQTAYEWDEGAIKRVARERWHDVDVEADQRRALVRLEAPKTKSEVRPREVVLSRTISDFAQEGYDVERVGGEGQPALRIIPEGDDGQ